jgi:1-acyl-sn-glycerol-3-phosphate acyltransferase
MLSFLPGPILGVLNGLLFFINLLVIPFAVIVIAVLEMICPIPRLRRWLGHVNNVYTPLAWVTIFVWLMKITLPTKLDVAGEGELDFYGWYFMTANHQSWLDILVLECAFKGRVPFMKFFMKQSLLWQLPIAGLACWLMNFPFMKRYSKSYLKKHPEKKGKDLAATKKACANFQNHPVTIINFVEGGRYTQDKHRNQKSPYQHLLKPKAAGMAFVLDAMNHKLQNFIDVTIVYPEQSPNLWDFLCGRMDNIIIRYRVMPVPNDMAAGYIDDPKQRVRFQRWLNDLWHQKDRQVDDLIQGKPERASSTTIKQSEQNHDKETDIGN